VNRVRILAFVGLGALAVGLAALFAPETFALGFDRLVISLVGALALLQAARVLWARLHAEFRRVSTPDPELPAAAPSPGEDIHSILSQFSDVRRLGPTPIREGLGSAARAVLERYGSATPDVEEQLDRGTWTDDPYAAWFLGGPTPGLATRTRALLSSDGQYVRRTVGAIADIAGLTSRPPSSDSDSDSDSPEEHRGHLTRLRGLVVGNASADPERTPRAADGGVDAQVGSMHRTGRWSGVSALALIGVGVGILAEQSGVLLVGAVGMGYAAYARSSPVPVADLSLERSIEDDSPDPGDELEVTVTVRNEGSDVLPDVRLVDGVPDALEVVDGSPRCGTVLRPGGSVQLRYTVATRQGHHEFGPLVALVRDVSAAGEREQLVEPDSRTSITCRPPLEALPVAVPLREQHTSYAGQVPTSTGGEGIEFYATRAYRPGDPTNRIDWNRRARTGRLATLEFRQERAATVVVVVDVRDAAYLAPDRRSDSAIDRATEAAGQIFATVLADGNQVGIAAYDDPECWLAPGSGRTHRVRARELLATAPAMNPGVDGRQSRPYLWARQLRRRVPDGTQFVFLSPLCDPLSERTVRSFDAHGYPMTVVSPDPTAAESPGQRLARLRRHLRIADLRGVGIPVVDWRPDESLVAALERAEEGRR